VPNCTSKPFNFSPLGRKKVIGSFSGGSITSDGGLLLLREVDKKYGITSKIGRLIFDKRNPLYITHTLNSMLRQRIYGIAANYEDLNDHDYLRHDPAFQIVINKEQELASSPTLSRLDNMVSRADCVAMSINLVEQFIASHNGAPKELVLDFDPTDYKLYGHQEDRHYHGYYEDYCYLPLYVFCGDHLLVAYLRPSDIDGALHTGAILKLLVRRFRQEWPDVKIMFRGDCAFARRSILHFCEQNNVDYVTGISQNKRIEKLAAPTLSLAKQQFDNTNTNQRIFTQFSYAAESWNHQRRIIAKVEQNSKGSNLRCVITNLDHYEPQFIYEQLYCPRGDMENYIKQQKLDLNAGRVSCPKFIANQFRVLLSAYAYVLLSTLKRKYLIGTKFENVYCSTLRNNLLKIGAIIIKNTRTVKFLFSSHYTQQELFETIISKLVPT
jgi:hypothetical protein